MSAPDDDDKLWATKFQIKGERYSDDIQTGRVEWHWMGSIAQRFHNAQSPMISVGWGRGQSGVPLAKIAKAQRTEQSLLEMFVNVGDI